MDVKKVKECRKAMEGKIAEAVSVFEYDTGLEVDDIFLEKIDTSTKEKKDTLIQIRTIIKIS